MSFHAKGGLYVERTGDGDVHVIVKADDAENAHIVAEVTLNAEQWAEAVAAVSRFPEIIGAKEAALEFHQGLIPLEMAAGIDNEDADTDEVPTVAGAVAGIIFKDGVPATVLEAEVISAESVPVAATKTEPTKAKRDKK